MVECLVWDQDAAGSNPVTSTSTSTYKGHKSFIGAFSLIKKIDFGEIVMDINMYTRKTFDFLEKDYGFKYAFQSFEKTANGSFWGPCEAHSYYNENGCFTIYTIVQRGDLEIYKSDKFSQNQIELLQQIVDLDTEGKAEWGKLRKSFFRNKRRFFQTLAEVIKTQIENTGQFYSIKI